MHAAATDTVGRHERPPGTDRQRGLVHLVAERERGLVRPQEQLVPNAIAQFVLHVGRREIGRRVAPGTSSMAMTSSPSSVSSCAMIEPVQPRPTMTTSFFGSLRAMIAPQRVFGVHSARPVMLTGGSGKGSL